MKYYQECPYCGMIAFQWKEKPYKGMKISASKIIAILPAVPGHKIKCQNCKRDLFAKDLNSRYLRTEK